MLMRPFETAIGAAVLATAISAAEVVPDRLTPEDAVALALAGHPLVVAADRAVDVAEADLSYAGTGYLPRVDAVVDATRSTNPTLVFSSKLGQEEFGPQDFEIEALNHPDALTNIAKRLVLKQSIWDAGRTSLGRRAAGFGLEAIEAERARTREEVAFGALRAYWGAVLADEMLEVARAAEVAARASFDLARAQVEEGLAVPSDRMQAEVRLSEIRTMVVRAEEGVVVSRAALRQALGLNADPTFALAPPVVEPSDDSGEVAPQLDEAGSSRPDLEALDFRVRQSEVGVDLAKSGWRPEIGLGAAVEWNGEELFSNTGSNWTVGAVMRLPVFEGRETRSKVARARAESERVQAYRRALDEGVRLEVQAAWAQRLSATERLRTARSAVGLAEEALRIVRERYGEGMAVMVELLGAEAAHTASRGARAAAVHDLALADAALDLATGRPVTGTLESSR
jgi:outer membrane protein TolC